MKEQTMLVQLDYQPPYRFDELLAFFRMRALIGVESVDQVSYARAVRMPQPDGAIVEGWIRVRDEPSHHRLALEMSDSLAPVMLEVAARVRRMFDTESDPAAIAEHLAPLKGVRESVEIDGVRLPGSFDPFEIACRAVLGQQVSVKAANKIAARIVKVHGAPVDTGIEGLDHAWPSPSDILGLPSIEDALGVLGVIKTRSRVIRELAGMFQDGELDFGAEATVNEQIERLLQVKGIGPWSANYIAMRAMSYPDAFLATDVGIAHALPELTPEERLAVVEPCRPWRSYANIALWNSLSV